ncbi:uncharacterized protein LOC131936985 [Physella acuta]|uniref:uncharacterized protein LOC131936985 n=1 Tax=Physella acuta TaxID=109671 RepID=UPI0027DBD46E|nr:uncharacterized protein LOC131936985 [Physella acuta]
MASIVLLSLFFVLQAQLTGGLVHMSANPSVIDLGLTSLTVRCDLNQVDQHNMSAILSIIVSRAANSSSTYTELASVVAFAGQPVRVLSSEGLTANGSIDIGSNSFLELQWEHPTEKQNGHYMCACQGLDIIGHNVNVMAGTDVTSRRPGSDQLLEKIRELDVDLKLAKQDITDLNSLVTVLIHNMSHSESISMAAQANIQLLQHYNSAMEEDRKSWLFSYSVHDRNTTYSLTRQPYMTVATAEFLCQRYGGYLVEIDDAREYHVVQGLLNYTDYVSYYIYTGIYKERPEGTFKFRRSQKPAQFFNWYPDQPTDRPFENCVFLLPEHNSTMYLSRCNTNNVQAVCEFPDSSN